MSATDELRSMLDERGVEHEGSERSLRWRDRHGIMMQAFPLANGELGMEVWSCTPEQAIAATLGDADLAAENAELREDLEFERSENGWAREFLNRMGQKCGTEDCPSLVAYVTKLESENANLRELVRDVNRAAHMLCEAWEGSCSKEAEGMSLHAVCPIGDTSELCVFGKLYDRMRDLGAEVE